MAGRQELSEQEERLRLTVRSLPEETRRIFYRRFEENVRDPDTYAVLNWFFVAGLHHFYLGLRFRGALNLALFSAGLALLFTGYWRQGLGVAAVVTLMELPALFGAQLIVWRFNNELMEKILADL